ncbi:DUF1622 domain-containing protein [Rugosimonospora africana]|uniref:Membrane protein n=1 Tax=Rugosimonospora africana TaxID=556532 RepID=A0A8J3VVN6_9ACTN|nr:DUF1622 domain-containing protein [Rugosimonospora africana]GIH19961.1 membrane protein [Rugosimonospora africana]
MLDLTDLAERVAQGFDVVGSLVLIVGLVWSVVIAIRMWRSEGGRRGYRALREAFGSVLLLALEFLVAADLVRTVAVSPTLRNVLVLGLIVVIRTFLSFSLATEIEGVAPWRRAMTSGAGAVARAARDNRGGSHGASESS